MKITIYEPVCAPKERKGMWFTVSGAADPDRDAAIRKASKHVSIVAGECEIKRVDEIEVDEDEWYAPRYY